MADHDAERTGGANPHAEAAAPSEFAREAVDADLTPLLKHMLSGATLSAEQTARAFEAMMTGAVHHGEMGALLALMASRTETSEEILGAARIMRRYVDRLETGIDGDELVDTAGTGGAPKTFNVSTAAALIAAGAGVKVPKHGNRSRTGRGSAEVLQGLGVNIDAGRETQQACLREAGVCFCFAVHHHPATRHVMPVRHALGFPTIFNLLGPLTNPAGAKRQVMGVYHDRFVAPIAEALAQLGATRAMVAHSDDGLDEFSISAPTRVMHVEDGSLREERLDPAAMGLTIAPREAVTAHDLDGAVRMVAGILDGTERGAPRDMALLSSAATLIAAGKTNDWREGLDQSAESIDSGAARGALEKLVACSAA
jgi:anthranilate phosphoribosyltransferase